MTDMPVRGPRKTWTLPIGEPNVGLTVTLSYGDPGRRWGACWYGRGVSGCRTPWGALWRAWRFRNFTLSEHSRWHQKFKVCNVKNFFRHAQRARSPRLNRCDTRETDVPGLGEWVSSAHRWRGFDDHGQ